MKIISIEIINQKKIRLFNAELDGGNLEVAGETGTGKTTAVSALWDIITKGGDTLTHGETKGHVRVKLGDGSDTYLVAERITTKKTSSITVQKFLGTKAIDVLPKDFEKMISSLSVNPHKIIDMKPTEKIKTLLRAADCDVDLDALDAEIEEAEKERLDAGRAADKSKPVEIPEKTEKVSISELVAQRDAIVAKNDKRKKNYAELDSLYERRGEVCDSIKELEEKLANMNDELSELSTRISGGEVWKKKNPLESTDELTAQIASAEETNERAAVYEQAVKHQADRELLLTIKKEADDKVKELRAQKKAALDAAHWPLDGLCVEDGVITYNGIILDNLGESEQMLVTAAIALGDIEKHPLKVVRIDGIESLSKKDYEKLREIFNGRGIQVLATRVSRNGTEPGEIEIVDGVYDQQKENADG